MFKIAELSRKDIINLKDGAKLGAVKDVHVDLAEGKVRAIVLEGPRKYFRLLGAGGGDIVVPWEKVKKIGVDAVLVELD
jgi:YlmC/YmxH family sporulation protein